MLHVLNFLKKKKRIRNGNESFNGYMYVVSPYTTITSIILQLYSIYHYGLWIIYFGNSIDSWYILTKN